MTQSKRPSSEEPGQGRPARKPRGLGGVLLIMALLAALFFVVSQSNVEDRGGLYAFYHRLFNGKIEEATLSDNTVVAFYREGAEKQRMEVVLKGFLQDDATLIRDLLAASRRAGAEDYPGGLRAFAEDVKNDRIAVGRAFFITEHGSLRSSMRDEPNRDDGNPHRYLTAIVQDDGGQRYVRADADDSGPKELQALEADLRQRGTTIDYRPLDLNPGKFNVREPNTALIYFLGTIGPYLLVILIIWIFIIRQMRSPGGTGGVLSFGRSRAALYTKENRTNVSFDDVAGIEEAKGEVQEVIEFLKHPGKFAKLGGSIPRGVLLVGSPGTGKTLLAKAIAGEAEVPFFSISGSDFVEMFVGVGASRVRDLFKQARECSPCLVFLDEIDAVGRKRGSGMGGGHDEREQTLNAILVEMDGFDSDKGIILIAATNRPDVLDPALLRPGRFDRQIVIDMPDVKGREAILKVHARKIKLTANVKFERIARATPGFSGAELAALVNEAAILAAMRDKDAVGMSELEEARDRVRWGREKRSRAILEEDRRVTAFHEAGHALVSTMIPELDPVHKVTIVSRGMALGSTMSLPEREDYHVRKSKLLGMIAMCYGGRIAEDLEFGDVSAGAQNDIEQATKLAKVMVCELGMSDKVGPINYTVDQANNFLGREFQLTGDLSPTTLDTINAEVRAIIDEQYARATKIITENRHQLQAIAEGLLKHETLSGEEIGVLLRGDDVDEYRAAQARSRPTPTPKGTTPREEPDVGLSGAEGLALP